MTTTLWARLVLGDLFLHGIGGAKYDRVNDRLIERFFGLPTPMFMVASATLHLPIDRPPAAPDDARAIDLELRALTYHPERWIEEADPEAADPMAADLMAAKRRWIETPETRQNAKRRCQAIRRINAALQPSVASRRARLIERRAEALRHLQAEKIFIVARLRLLPLSRSGAAKAVSGVLRKSPISGGLSQFSSDENGTVPLASAKQ